jgi:hypothetical protein
LVAGSRDHPFATNPILPTFRPIDHRWEFANRIRPFVLPADRLVRVIPNPVFERVTVYRIGPSRGHDLVVEVPGNSDPVTRYGKTLRSLIRWVKLPQTAGVSWGCS